MSEDDRRRDEAMNALDAFGLLACQNYNLGNRGNWLLSFRAGLKGVRSRAEGWAEHVEAIHSWVPLQHIEARERHLAGALFCMDSALECLVFALNAIGNAVEPSAFRDITSRKELSRVSPRNVVGGNNEQPLLGYAKYFPTVQAEWARSANTISLVCDNHDVSKHRQATFWGGTLRDDPPDALRAAIEADDKLIIFSPMAEVLLPRDPKAPLGDLPKELEHWVTFEQLQGDLSLLLTTSVELALDDAVKHIPLPEKTLRESSA